MWQKLLIRALVSSGSLKHWAVLGTLHGGVVAGYRAGAGLVAILLTYFYSSVRLVQEPTPDSRPQTSPWDTPKRRLTGIRSYDTTVGRGRRNTGRTWPNAFTFRPRVFTTISSQNLRGRGSEVYWSHSTGRPAGKQRPEYCAVWPTS